MSTTFLSQSVGGQSALGSFSRSVDPQQLQTYLALEQAEILRLRRYNEFWRFYLGQHWSFTREGGEPLVTLNYCRRVVNKIVDWMTNEGMQITVPEPLRNHTLPVIAEVWKYNKEKEWLRAYATTGSVTGDVFILVTYEDPTIQARRMNPHTQGRIRIQLLGSEQVFPTWDPLNKDTLLQVRIETLYYDASASQTMQEQMNSTQRSMHVLRFTQIITRDKIIEQFQGAEPMVRDNILGEIALVHVANQIVPGEYYGLSDIDGLTNLNREINEKVTDISDIINYHASPVTVITGAKAGNLERSPKQIWSGLPADARVTNLELGTSLDAPIEYVKLMREVFMEMSNVPETSLGKEQAVSNTSGVALAIQYAPLVEIIKRKAPQYTRGIEEVNYYILRIKEIVDRAFVLPTDLCANCGGKIAEVTYPDGSTRRKCYMIDPLTFDFLPPDQVKIQHIRLHSFGPSLDESPASQVQSEHNMIAPSAWDPEKSKSAPAAHAEAQAGDAKAADAAGAVPAPKAPYEPPKMQQPPNLPDEPERVAVQRATINPDTGELELDGLPKMTEVVPTGCEAPAYLNPFESTVVLKDVLPKDKLLDSQYFAGLKAMGVVSKDWVREHIDDIENPAEEKKRCDDEDSKTAALAQQAGGHGPGQTGAPPPKALSGKSAPPSKDEGGSAADEGGDAT